jgi:anti-sigma factor (TIGR02949 family)
MNAFDCAETFRRLADYLDKELTAEEIRLVEAHLEQCEMCASEYRFEGSLLRDLKEKARAGAAPPELRASVEKLLQQARQRE